MAQEVCLAAITALPRYRDRGLATFLAFHGIAAHGVADAIGQPAVTGPIPPKRFLALVSDAGPEQMAIEADSVTG